MLTIYNEIDILVLDNELSENYNNKEVDFMIINVKEIVGEQINIEDAIVLRDTIRKYIKEGITLDFAGLENIPSTFLTCLFADLINEAGRETIFNNINVKNLTNYNDYSRVVMGTAFIS